MLNAVTGYQEVLDRNRSLQNTRDNLRDIHPKPPGHSPTASPPAATRPTFEQARCRLKFSKEGDRPRYAIPGPRLSVTAKEGTSRQERQVNGQPA